MCAALCEHPRVLVEGERTPIDSDREKISALMLDAYRGTIDDEGESIVEARAEVDGTFDGKYGKFLPDHSSVVVRDNKIVSALLLTEWKGSPFVAFTMTAKEWQRMGLSKNCMTNVMHDLFEARHSSLSLAVTINNHPAVNLYASLGFIPQQNAG